MEAYGSTAPGRDVSLVWVVDVSGSMAPHGHIESVNHTMGEVFAYLRGDVGVQPGGTVTTRVLTFSDTPEWTMSPTALEDAVWQTLHVHPQALSELGLAIDAVTSYLQERVALVPSARPVVVLLSDGRHTDVGRPFDDALADFTATEVGAAAIRVAVGIGERDDVDRDALSHFASSERHLMTTSEATRIVTWLQSLSTTLIHDRS